MSPSRTPADSPDHATHVSPEEALAAAAVAEADALAALTNEVSELKAKNAELAEQYLRSQAEACRTRRRRAEEEVVQGAQVCRRGLRGEHAPRDRQP